MKLTTDLNRTPTPLLIWRFGCAEISGRLRQAARGLGFGKPSPLPLSSLPIPDSAAVQQAIRLVADISPAFLFNHCIRTYLFGEAIGRRGKLKYDREVLFLASLMHDLGLLPEFKGERSFELEGARAARAFLLDHGMPEEKADLVHEAIALHAAVGIASKKSPEIALVHFGAGMDVFGFRAEDIAPRTIEGIIEAHPRLGFKEAFGEMLEVEAGRKPGSHIAGHVSLGFRGKIQSGPFAD